MKDTEAETEKLDNETPEPLAPLDAATVAPNQLEELQTRASKADEHWDRLVRTMADFDNFKKRAAREKQDAIRYANEALIEKLVPVLDNFEMALNAARTSSGDTAQSLREGIGLIHQQFKKVLADSGLVEVDATGQQFDPNWHEAVSQQETAEVPEGCVIQQVRKGYKLRDRLLRPASVVVAKEPTKDEEASR